MVEKSKKKKINILFFIRNIIYFLLLLFLGFALFIKKKFHNVGFEQLLFTLTNPDGANYDVVWTGILFVFLFTFGIILGIFIIKKVFKFLKISVIFEFNIKSKKINKRFNYDVFKVTKFRQIAWFVIILILGTLIPINMIDFNTYVKAQKVNSEFFEEYYVNPSEVNVSFEGKKRNLIYIFVESLESSNASSANGGLFEESYIPNLEQLALDNINFSNINWYNSYT